MAAAISLLALCTLTLGIVACTQETKTPEAPANPFQTFRDIPGIADEEIAAIERLQARTTPQAPLIFAASHSTELFEYADGTLGGYMVLFCDWLSGLINVPVHAEIHSITEMNEGLDSGIFDFAAVMATPDRLGVYSMTDPIAQRIFVNYRYEGSPSLAEISAERLPRYAFAEGSSMIPLVAGVLEPGTYEEVIVANEDGLYWAVRNGDADAFVLTQSLMASFDQYSGIYTEDFLPLTFLHVSVAAANSDYGAVISIINKALQYGAAEYLADLYKQGHQEYMRHKFVSLLTNEEIEYMRDNPVIPYAIQYSSYPISFYDAREGKWDGIAIDTLDEIRRLTGLEFEVIHADTVEAPELVTLLESEAAYFMPHLIYNPGREGMFDWLRTHYVTDRYALLSKQSYPNVELNDIPSARVGVVSGTTFAEMFNAWFPDALYVTEYPTTDDVFVALDRGEVDLVMSLQSRLTALTNYYEFSDYKANYSFDDDLKITMAVNKNQPVLYSILDKVLPLINTDRINEQWMTRTYSIEAAQLRTQRPWLIGIASLSLALLVLVVVIFYLNRKALVERAVMHETEERVRLLLDATPLGVNLIDKDLQNIFVNEEAVRIFGLSSKQEYIEKFTTGINPKYQPDGRLSSEKISENIRKTLKEGALRFEWTHQMPGGEPFPCEVTLVRIKYKDDYVVAGYARDLREEKRLQEEKRDIEKEHLHLREILDTLPVGIRILSLDDMTLLYSNKACLDVFGCSSFEEQVAGRSGLGFMPEMQPDGKSTAEHLAEIIENNKFISELQCFKLDGTEFMCRISSIAIEYAGHRASLAAMEDVTAEREHQERLRNAIVKEQEANLLKSRFLAHMSHEIRTPMNAILGITEIELQNESLPPETVESLDIIYESGNLLLNIINDILDLSAIEAGKLEIVQSRYDVSALINSAVQISRIRYDSKPIEFFLDIDENTPLNLFGDKFRLEQILNNILSNAYKYTEKGAIRLSISAEAAGGDDVTLVMRVSDTGSGMTQDEIDKLFIEFTRFNFDSAGTGLGMSITKRLLDLMGGEIYIESEPGKGSVFAVHIPQKRVDGLVCGPDLADEICSFRFQRLSMSKKSHMLREHMPYGSVLIVDDVQSNIYVAKGMLLPYGLQIDSAESGRAAIEKINGGNLYDIIFMDHMMPGLDGIATAKILRGMGYEKSIVALTANALVGNADIFLDNDFDGYISKPIDPYELNAILVEFIRDKKPPEVVKAAQREQRAGRADEVAGVGTTAPGRPQEQQVRQDADEKSEIEELFILDAESAVEVLRELYEKLDSFDEDDYDMYDVTVHGMKGALLNIGETELSRFAYKLEKAAVEYNLDLMRTETPAFLKELEAVIEKLRP